MTEETVYRCDWCKARSDREEAILRWIHLDVPKQSASGYPAMARLEFCSVHCLQSFVSEMTVPGLSSAWQ